MPVSWLVERLTEAAHADLRALVERAAVTEDVERKRQLLLHLHGTRQRLLRLLVLCRWSVQVHVPSRSTCVRHPSHPHGHATF